MTAATGLKPGHFAIQSTEQIVFGVPLGAAIVAEAERYGAKRVFVTSTRSLAKLADGPLQKAVRALGSRCVGTFHEIAAHSPREDVIAGANAARAAKADLLVAVGAGDRRHQGDAALSLAWLRHHREHGALLGRHRRLEECSHHASCGRHPHARGSSTTLSASEFTRNAGVTLSATIRTVLQPPPDGAAVDHSLFRGDAGHAGLAALLHGIRAVDHAVESYCNPAANPATEALSLQGLRLLNRALPRVKADPASLDARLEAQFGMWQAIAASASGIGTGASHGIGYALGATFGVAHGHTSCVMLPAVLTWNASVNGERSAPSVGGDGRAGPAAGELVKALIAGLGQPTTLREVGITRENLDEIARRSLAYKPVQMNPRRVASASDVREILELAW